MSSARPDGSRGPAVRAHRFLRPYRGLFVFGQLATLLAAAAGLAFPLITRDVVDALVGATETASIRSILPVLGGAFALLAVFTFVKERSLRTLSLKVVYDLRNRVFAKIGRLRYEYFDRNSSGDLISTMTNDVNRFQDSVAGGLSFLLSQSISLIAILIILFTIDVVLTLVILALVPLLFVIIRGVSKRVRSHSRRVQHLLGQLTSIASEAVHGIDVIKSFVLREPATEIFESKNREVLEVATRQVRWSAGSAAVSTVVGGIAIITLIGVGGVHVTRGILTTGELVAYIIYAQMIVGPIGMLSGIVVEVQRALAAIERVFALLDADEETDRIAGSAVPSTRNDRGASLEIDGVSFSYVDGEPVLSDIAMRIEPGEFVALVGPSGAGKSTLLKLLVRFYDPSSGRILLDGADVGAWPVETLRREMALVMQDTHLFDMSVAENLRCGRVDAADSQLRSAAMAAGAAEFIERLPEGYASRIGENGTQLSGGQRQRLSLARAFLKGPRVLLLDEATSSLDTETERRIQAALARLMRGRTTIAIAHRLSTVLHADRIFLMDGGRIADVGPHRELIARNELYAKLCRHQMITSNSGGNP